MEVINGYGKIFIILFKHNKRDATSIGTSLLNALSKSGFPIATLVVSVCPIQIVWACEILTAKKRWTPFSCNCKIACSASIIVFIARGLNSS